MPEGIGCKPKTCYLPREKPCFAQGFSIIHRPEYFNILLIIHPFQGLCQMKSVIEASVLFAHIAAIIHFMKNKRYIFIDSKTCVEEDIHSTITIQTEVTEDESYA